MGLLDTIVSGYKTGMGFLAPTDKDLEMRANAAKGLLDFAPIAGDAISGYEAIQSARQGNYGEAALNGIGLLPFLPSMGGIIKNIKSPEWNALRKEFPVGINPTREEVFRLLQDAQSKSALDTLRTIKDTKTNTLYAWPADAALHSDIGEYFKLIPGEAKHGIIAP